MLINKSCDCEVLCVGEVLWDMLPTGPKVGGAPMNVALHLRKLGVKSRFAGRVGNDRLGKSIKEFLNNHGLRTDLIQTDFNFPTSTVEVVISEDHQVKFDIIDNVAWDRIELTDELDSAGGNADVIIYGTLASRHAITRNTVLSIIENHSLKLIDVNFRPPFINKEVVESLIRRADIAKLNDDELKVIGSWYSKEAELTDLLKWFADRYATSLICLTRGAKGAMIFDQGKIIEHPGYKVDVIDTVGAGDAFLAGFLKEYLDNKSLEEALDLACATGAFVASKSGATPDYALKEIINLMKKK